MIRLVAPGRPHPELEVGDVVRAYVTVGASRSHFTCPVCAARISYDNAYPVGFHWKVCPKCRVQWSNLADGIGPHRRDIEPGELLTVDLLYGYVFERT